MFKHILVPTDGSDLSLKPLQSAIAFAKHHHGSIVTLSVSEPRMFYGTDPEALKDGQVHEEDAKQEAMDTLQGIRDAARQAKVPCQTVIVQSSSPAEEIVRAAKQYGCDAIFMATRGTFSMLDKLFDESQTHKVLETASVPVVVFP